MKAAHLRRHGEVTVEDVPTPKAGRGEIVVGMKACGLCGSDIEKIRGAYTAAPPVIGHEAVGVVTDVGPDVLRIHEGDRVFPHHHVPCGDCVLCRRGSPTMCAHYRATNLEPGGFAEFFRVPQWNVQRGGVLSLPNGMDFESGTFIEPLACVIRALDRCPVGAESALVVGTGPMGLLAIQLLRLRGSDRVFASEVSPIRLAMAHRLGADLVCNPTLEDVPSRMRAITNGVGTDVVIVATGHPPAITQAIRAVRAGGTVCLLGVPEAGSRLDVDPSEFVTREISLVPSNAATEIETRKALTFIDQKKIDVASLVTHRFPVSQFPDAVRVAQRAECVKAIITA